MKKITVLAMLAITMLPTMGFSLHDSQVIKIEGVPCYVVPELTKNNIRYIDSNTASLEYQYQERWTVTIISKREDGSLSVEKVEAGKHIVIGVIWRSYAGLRYFLKNGAIRYQLHNRLRSFTDSDKKVFIGRLDINDNGFASSRGFASAYYKPEYIFWTTTAITAVTPSEIQHPICGKLEGDGQWGRVTEYTGGSTGGGRKPRFPRL